MRKFIFILLSGLGVMGCTNSNQSIIPDGIFSKNKMVAVLTDVHLEEASMNLTGVSSNNLNIGFSDVNMNLNILKKNNITKKEFDRSFQFYSEHPRLLGEVYKMVIDTLSRMQAEEAKK